MTLEECSLDIFNNLVLTDKYKSIMFVGPCKSSDCLKEKKIIWQLHKNKVFILSCDDYSYLLKSNAIFISKDFNEYDKLFIDYLANTNCEYLIYTKGSLNMPFEVKNNLVLTQYNLMKQCGNIFNKDTHLLPRTSSVVYAGLFMAIYFGFIQIGCIGYELGCKEYDLEFSKNFAYLSSIAFQLNHRMKLFAFESCDDVIKSFSL